MSGKRFLFMQVKERGLLLLYDIYSQNGIDTNRGRNYFMYLVSFSISEE